ncbi:Ribosomal large subunit pseudouridine synthase D [Enhygromyxa salina]|uniref:Pseudouridine synthase n=1 Tax=Enhygromyxa salina TaxID=215803 RepID=A0A0C2D226_9BACT|nr:RluA family pseudouridine synthase [Enhygromyxa salina]KIG17291.1 Ribosomal large subunit pseudouridine synthase D [Enhygromyxa salina]
MQVGLSEAVIGQRLDRALVEALVGLGHEVTRSQLARSFAAGQVRINGRVAKRGTKLERACKVELELLAPEPLAHAEPEPIPLTIVHEDRALLVIDKPAGMVVHAGPGHSHGTLVNAVLHHLALGRDAHSLPVLPGNGPERPGVVHRLDRHTSGLIVVAKTLPALTALAEQFRAHSIERAYLGIVHGFPDWAQRRVETWHGRDPSERRRFSPEHGERRAITTMSVVRPLGDAAALLRFELETGRTHQIRMHARHVGHPIFADELYGRRVRDPGLQTLTEALGRHALHAAVLGFEHPDGGRLRFESPLPAELEQLAAALRARV